MVALLLVLGGLLVIGSFAFAMWGDSFLAVIGGLLLGLGLLVWGTILFDQHQTASCEASGGHVRETGHTSYVLVGNVMVPVEDTECFIP